MSDMIIKAAERIQGLYHQGIYQGETDKIAAILREAFPAPSAQEEDEKALDMRKLAEGALDAYLHSHGDYNEGIKSMMSFLDAALRSRLAEPWTAADEELYKWAKAENDRKAKPEPAQAAPSKENALEDLDAMKRRLMDESDAMDEVATHRWWWRYSQNTDSRLRAALASERAKHEDRAPGYVCPACGQRYIDPEAVVTLDKLVKQARPAPDAAAHDLGFLVQSWAQNNRIILGPHCTADLANRLAAYNAPDAAALRARVLVACIETESALARHEVEHGDGWLYNHADVIRGYKTELEVLLRSEPRGEEGR